MGLARSVKPDERTSRVRIPAEPSLENHQVQHSRGASGGLPGFLSRESVGRNGLPNSSGRDANGVAVGAATAVDRAASSAGEPLPEAVRGRFERSAGEDLSEVRIHTGAESARAASAVGARAYTIGQDIHFGEGKYAPGGSSGMHLLAHEVAHTVQNRNGAPAIHAKPDVSTPSDSHEAEADRAANAIVSGGKASISASGGLSRRGISRGIATAYSDDKDLKQLPSPPSYTQPDNSFTAMAQAVQSSMLGGAGTVSAPTSGFGGSVNNLVECRNNAESSNVYYSTNLPSKWNPFDAGNFNDVYAQIARDDQGWALNMLGDVRIASSATASWVGLANSSNSAWADLVKQAQAMSIEVVNKKEKVPLLTVADGQDHYKDGDQEINKVDVGGAAMGLGVEAKKAGLKAPDTGAYSKAMQDYTKARNDLAPKERFIIGDLIPSNQKSIKDKAQKATDEKEKWTTISEATETFEKGLTAAISGVPLAEEGVGTLGTTEEGLAAPKEIDAKDAVEKGGGVLSKVIGIRIQAIQRQIDAYNGNLKGYTDVAEANAIKAKIGEYQNALLELRDKATNVEHEQAKLQTAFSEFAKSVDEEMIRKGQLPKGSDDSQQAAALFVALRTASVTTQGAIAGLSSHGAADLGTAFGNLAQDAAGRNEAQTGGNGRQDARSVVFGIESRRWAAAQAAVDVISGELARRQVQLAALETEFLTQFASASRGTDSIK